MATVIVEPATGAPDEGGRASPPPVGGARSSCPRPFKELAAERLGPGHDARPYLRPVMFELGARPTRPVNSTGPISLKPTCSPGFTGACTHVCARPLPGQQNLVMIA